MSTGSSGSLKIYPNKSSQLEIPTIKKLNIQPQTINLQWKYLNQLIHIFLFWLGKNTD